MYSYQIHAYYVSYLLDVQLILQRSANCYAITYLTTMHENVSDKYMSKVLYLQVCHADVCSAVYAYLYPLSRLLMLTTDMRLR